jgi:hypothetical protein
VRGLPGRGDEPVSEPRSVYRGAVDVTVRRTYRLDLAVIAPDETAADGSLRQLARNIAQLGLAAPGADAPVAHDFDVRDVREVRPHLRDEDAAGAGA